MTRLADQIMAIVGGQEDQLLQGAISSLAKSLARAECFELSRDVALAIKTVHSVKPSTLLAALSFSRPPFPRLWVEWVAPEINAALARPPGPHPLLKSFVDETVIGDRPIPDRVGALIEDIGIPGLAMVTWAWSQKAYGVNVCPLGLAMAWTLEGMDIYRATVNHPSVARLHDHLVTNGTIASGHAFHPVEPRRLTLDDARNAANLIEVWQPHQNKSAELEAIIELEKKRDQLTAAPYCVNFLTWLLKNLSPEKYQVLNRSWFADLSGEPWFIRAFLILLNTKNGVISTREDLTRLNRARRKTGKRELREFQITRINLSKHGTRAAEQGRISREMARQHYVRGHFKVRRTGVFWWSPFVRGNSEIAVPRERYSVVRSSRS